MFVAHCVFVERFIRNLVLFYELKDSQSITETKMSYICQNRKCRSIFAMIQILESYFTFEWSTIWAYRVLLWQASYILIGSQMPIAFYTEITLNFFWVCIFWSWLGCCFSDIMKRWEQFFSCCFFPFPKRPIESYVCHFRCKLKNCRK